MAASASCVMAGAQFWASAPAGGAGGTQALGRRKPCSSSCGMVARCIGSRTRHICTVCCVTTNNPTGAIRR
eukprot:3794125-Pyramimonas_sp.AAC.1